MVRFIIVAALLLATGVGVAFAEPCNPNATPEAVALLDYLEEISGEKILSGQESMFNQGAVPSEQEEYIFERVQKYPAIYCSDFGDFSTENLRQRRMVVANCGKYHKDGAIIALQYHMVQPDKEDGAGFQTIQVSGYSRLGEILSEGSELNRIFKMRLDEIAKYFNAMERSGIAILWRPYHEMNCNCFWWANQDRFKDLWIYTWKYLTEEKKCNNLLWVFGVNYYQQGATGKNGPDFYYPGHEYVDILSVDVYEGSWTHGFQQHLHDDLLRIGGGKPIAIAENGKMPDISSIFGSQSKWVYWTTWWSFHDASNDQRYKSNYEHPAVVTRDELPLDKLRPTTAAERFAVSAIENTRRQITVIGTREGYTVTASKEFDIIEIISVNGTTLAHIKGNHGTFSCKRLPSGTFIIRASGKKCSVSQKCAVY